MNSCEKEQAIDFFKASIAHYIIDEDTVAKRVSNLSERLKSRVLMGDSENLRTYFNNGKSFPDSIA